MSERPKEPRTLEPDQDGETAIENLRNEIAAAKEKSRRYRAGLRAVGRLDPDEAEPSG